MQEHSYRNLQREKEKNCLGRIKIRTPNKKKRKIDKRITKTDTFQTDAVRRQNIIIFAVTV